MVELRELIHHGPHYWYCSYLITDTGIWLDFLGNGNYQKTRHEVG